MGLTVSYGIETKMKSENKVRQSIAAMRNICMDLPFEEVGEIIELTAEDFSDHARALRKSETLPNGRPKNEEQIKREAEVSELAFGLSEEFKLPWAKQRGKVTWLYPSRVIGFTTWPGEGCEGANFGFATYPKTATVDYIAVDDDRFKRKGEFDMFKWRDYKYKHNLEYHATQPIPREVPTKLTGWKWHNFCKTQYASEPDCGGLPNFLKCHITLITAIERIAKLDGIKMEYNDEGHYGESTYSDDYREAYAAGKEPTYVWHPATYNIAELAKQVGDYNELVAAFCGAISDAVEGTEFSVDAPIKSYSNFEQLEFRGSQDSRLQPFLLSLKQLVDTNKVADTK